MGTTGILSWINSETGLGLLRNLLMAAGSGLVTQGVLTQGGLNDTIGAVLVILGVVLSAISNRNKAKAEAVVKAVNDHPALTIIPPEQTITGKTAISIAPSMGVGSMSGGSGKPNPAAHLQ